MKINGIEVPEPMREAPTHGTWYWFPDLGWPRCCAKSCWYSHPADIEKLQRGLCHSTESSARAHFEALIAPSRADAKPNSVEIEGIKEPKWINWNGGVRPVPPGTDTEIKQRCGHTHRSTHPQDWSWLHSPMHDSMEIIAYRVWPAETKRAEQHAAPTPCTHEQSLLDLVRASQDVAEKSVAMVREIAREAEVERRNEREWKRFELVKAAMQGLLASSASDGCTAQMVAHACVVYADEMLSKLERTR